MNSAVRINVRVLMGNAIAQFQRLTAQMRLMEAAAAQSQTAAGRFGARWTNTFKGIELAGKRLGQTGRILTYTFTMPLVLAFAALERQMLAVTTQMSLLRQVYTFTGSASMSLSDISKQTEADLKGLETGALALSNGFGVAKDKVVGLMVTFGRAGQSGVQLGQSTELALEIMRAYQVEAPQAADAILTVANAYQLTGRQVNVAMAELAVVSQNTRADFDTVTRGIVKAAPAAQQAGIDIAHLATYLGVMQQAGFKGAEAGTALNFMLTRILKVTPESADLLNHLGVQIDKAAYAAASGTQKFDMIAHAVGGLTGNQRALALATIFGARQAPKAIAMYGALLRQGGLYDQLLAKLTDSTSVLTSMEKDLVTAMANPATQFAILKTQLLNNFMVIAYRLTPALLALMQMFVKVSEAFANLDPKTQSWIILGLAILAVIGPIGILLGSLAALVGFIGHMVALMVGAAAALASPWIAVSVALGALLIFSARFRDQFIAVFAGLARIIMRIAMVIYEAFQWMNPFARHSPSLVERTRDGVAAMVAYWSKLRPALTVFDAAESAVRRFGTAMAKFTKQMEAAQQAQQRSDIGKVAGPGAVKAYDDLIAKNKALAAQLPAIEAAYNGQAKVVDKAKAALDGANASLDAAEQRIDDLRKAQEKLQDLQDKLGDAKGLRSQAAAASSMARGLADAGNSDLASRFAAQAAAMENQAKEAEKNQAALDSVTKQIKDQSDEIDRLRQKRDALSALYDTEIEKLDLLRHGYEAVTQAIKDNADAADKAAASAAAHLAELEAARKAAEAAAKAAKGKGNDFAAFDAAAKGPALPKMEGAAALPKNLPKGFDEKTIDEWVAGVQKRTADRLLKIMPNPFTMIGHWFDNIKNAWKAVQNWFDGLHGPDLKPSLPDPGLRMPEFDMPGNDWGKPIIDALGRIKDTLTSIDLDALKAKFFAARDGIMAGWNAFADHMRKPMEDARDAIASALGVVLDIVNDIIKVVLGRLIKIFGVVADFWSANGKQIGQIVGVIAAFFLDWYVMLLKIATFAVKMLWPVFKMGLDGIMQVFEGVFQVVSGLLQFVIQLLTGNFTAAWDGVKKMLTGLGNIVVGLGKVLIAALVGFVVWLAVDFIGIVVATFARLGPLALRGVEAMGKAFGHLVVWVGEALVRLGAKIVEMMPEMVKAFGWIADSMARYFWEILKGTASALWNLAGFIGELIMQYAPKILEDFLIFAKDIPKMIWDGIVWGFGAYIDLYKFFGEKIIEWGPKILEAFLNLAKSIPSKIWEGIKFMWEQGVPIVSHFMTWLGSKEISIFKTFTDFAKQIPGKIWDAIKGAWEAAVRLGDYVQAWIAEHAPSWWGHFVDFFKEIPGKMWDAFKFAWGKYVEFGGWIGGKIADAAGAIGTKAKELAVDILTKFKDKAIERIETVFKFGDWIVSKITGATTTVVTEAGNLAWDLIMGLVHGIQNNASKVGDAIMDAAKGAFQKAVDFFKIGSPSKLMRDEVGARLMQGWAIGINGSSGLVSTAMVDSARAAYDQLAAVQAASMTMPTLVQNVRLNYLNSPLTGTPDMLTNSGGALMMTGDRAMTAVAGGDTHINIDASKGEVADPMAMAQVLGWALKTGGSGGSN